jgi:hypothetical protein
MQAPTIYYSKFCDHSKELITDILKANLIRNFNMICVDEVTEVPSFVDRVPLMYYEKKMLVDEGLFNYIRSLMANKVQEHEITACTITELKSSNLSDAYSYLTDEDKVEKNFMRISEGEQRIYTPEDDAIFAKSQISLEDLTSKRENEMYLIYDDKHT